ncbi:MAG: sugar ABC transporter ATP-binding protein [Anaerolineaceae bacterium]|nr:sugar ABC transporter ATP-binding protein [Anaerolineaceae bacterium]
MLKPETKKPLVLMKGINKSFPGVQALSDAQLDLYKGEVLGLIGENGAGKSTLMNILAGIFPQDSGSISINGKEVCFRNPNEALKAGIAMIHQELCLVPDLSVAENIWVGRENKFSRFGLISKNRMAKAAENLECEFDIHLDVNRPVSELSIAEMQLVEILRAVSFKSDLIIMDEPTSALTNKEISSLFKIIDNLKAKGVAFIFISHKLEELLATCDRIVVMRDSQYIGTYQTDCVDEAHLVKLMVGRELGDYYQKEEVPLGPVVLELRHFSRAGYFNDISFSLHQGEILGLSGVVGAGRSEIARALFGMDSGCEGEVWINGRQVCIKNPQEAIRHGLALVTEDRSKSGLVLSLPVLQNVTLARLWDYCKADFIRSRLERKAGQAMINKLAVKVNALMQLTRQLSGGNQQKVVLAKWLLCQPKILILDEPTRGIDVGSKSEIYKLMNALVKEGMAILMISSELPEILGMSDRILVIREGQLVRELPRQNATQEEIIRYSIGSKQNAYKAG